MINFIVTDDKGTHTFSLDPESVEARTLLATGKILCGTLYVQPAKLDAFTEEQIAFLSRDVQGLTHHDGLHHQAATLLARSPLRWVWQICEQSPELKGLQGCGNTNRSRIVSWLRGHGVELDMAPRLDSIRHLLPEGYATLTDDQIDTLNKKIADLGIFTDDELTEISRFEEEMPTTWHVCSRGILWFNHRRVHVYERLREKNLRTGMARQIEQYRSRLLP